MRALYDLGKYLTSFNFFEWLVVAKAHGATRVIFDIRNLRQDKWPIRYARERFWSICVPGCALAGLPFEVYGPARTEPTNARDMAQPGGKPLVDFWKAGGRFERLRSVKKPVRGRHQYTVTMRKTQRSPLRDSAEDVWLPFAESIGALVIPDYDDRPIHLHDRVALYGGAEMNFFVSNGPGVLCSLTEYPCMLFNTVHARGSLLADGLADGDQYPWMLQNQRAIWEEATLESLHRHFDHWRANERFAEDRYVPPPPPAS